MFLDFKEYFSSSIAVLAQARHGHTRQAEVSGRQHPPKKKRTGKPDLPPRHGHGDAPHQVVLPNCCWLDAGSRRGLAMQHVLLTNRPTNMTSRNALLSRYSLSL